MRSIRLSKRPKKKNTSTHVEIRGHIGGSPGPCSVQSPDPFQGIGETQRGKTTYFTSIIMEGQKTYPSKQVSRV